MDQAQRNKILHLLACATCFLLPFKLNFAYIALVPLILLYVLFCGSDLIEQMKSVKPYRAFFLFAIVAMGTSFFGIHIGRSFQHIGTLFFFPLTMLVFSFVVQRFGYDRLFRCSLFGFGIACILKYFEKLSIIPDIRLLGSVSQSGQLCILMLPLGIFLLNQQVSSKSFSYFSSEFLSFLFYFLLSPGIGFIQKPIVLNGPVGMLTGFCFIVPLLSVVLRISKENHHRVDWAMYGILAAACITNLKRGPWIGIAIGLSLLSLLHSKKILFLCIGTICIGFILDPVRERMITATEHFFIAGGRSAIWDIGHDLALKYPLGIGFENSGFLRSFSSVIPHELKHFHNNFLNILVETGWMGLLLYSAWIFSTIALFLKVPTESRSSKLFFAAIGCALISWQITGLVEYNFGDSAVVTFAYILMGIGFGVASLSLRESEGFAAISLEHIDKQSNEIAAPSSKARNDRKEATTSQHAS